MCEQLVSLDHIIHYQVPHPAVEKVKDINGRIGR